MLVIYMSGYTDDAILNVQACERGCTFMQKLFTPTMVANTVRAVLDKQQPTK